jgi:hypothetical protein
MLANSLGVVMPRLSFKPVSNFHRHLDGETSSGEILDGLGLVERWSGSECASGYGQTVWDQGETGFLKGVAAAIRWS